VIAALEPGRTSWTAVLDAVRLGPNDDEAEVTAAQVRSVVNRLTEAGHWRAGDPRILVIFDAGYDVPRLAFALADLPVEVLGRLRSDRVLYLPAPARRRVRPRRPGHLARAAGRHHDGDRPVWHRRGASLGPAAPPAHPPFRLARSRRRPASHRRDADPPAS